MYAIDDETNTWIKDFLGDRAIRGSSSSNVPVTSGVPYTTGLHVSFCSINDIQMG